MTDKATHARNQRQYKLMLERLEQFENDEIGLRRLIDDLSGLLGALNDIDEEWNDEFERTWGVLEDVYAGALSSGYKTLPDEDRKLIWTAVDKLAEMVKPRVEPKPEDNA